MFLDHKDHYNYLEKLAKQNPDEAIISSFGLYAGITFKGHDTTNWGPNYQSKTRKILEALRKCPDVLMLIGVSNYNNCKSFLDKPTRCIPCEIKYTRSLFRILSHAELFPEFKWRITTELHLKCSLFKYGESWKGLAGGRNFTDSGWADITFELAQNQITTLLDHVLKLWDTAQDITEPNISELLVNEDISEQALVAMG
jgi:hypothetical protein